MFSELEGTLFLDVAHPDQVDLAAHFAVNLQMAGAQMPNADNPNT